MKVELIKESSKDPKAQRKFVGIAIFGIFLVIFLSIIITTFFGSFPLTASTITGGVVSNVFNNGEIDYGSIEFESDLTIPELSIDGEFDKVELSGSSNSFLEIGNQIFYLGNLNDNFIVFDNFDGSISFDKTKITELKGKVSSVTINGIEVEPKKQTIKVELGGTFDYDSLEISEGVFIKKLSYSASGTVKLNDGKEIFNLDQEEITIKEFYGSLLLDKGKFSIDGYIRELDIAGDSNINIKENSE